ncbi:MAG: hypothetical protein AAF959_15630 [Cyanobacteria bacterium P01_D01_bin.56]
MIERSARPLVEAPPPISAKMQRIAQSGGLIKAKAVSSEWQQGHCIMMVVQRYLIASSD